MARCSAALNSAGALAPMARLINDVPEIGQVFELAHPDILALLEAVGVRYIMPGGGQR